MPLLALAATTLAAFAVVTAAARVRPRVVASRRRDLTGAVVAASAVLGAVSGAGPTGFAPADAIAAALFAAACSAAGARARRWALLVASGAAAIGVPAAGWDLLVHAALGGALGLAAGGVRGRVAGAAVAGVAAQGLLRLELEGTFAASALLAAVAVTVLVVSAWTRLSPSGRRVAHRGAAAALGTLTLVLLAVGLAAVDARESAARGVDAATAGLEAARTGDREVAARRLDEASRQFRRARSEIGAWWARPARVVPAVAHNVRAVETLATVGANLAGAATTAVRDADMEGLAPVDGVVDLAGIGAIEASLAASLDAIDGAEADLGSVDRRWLLPQVAEPLERLTARVADARTSTETALDVARVAPGLLGADGPRVWFLAVVTPAEQRGSGGFLGSYGEVVTDAGRVEVGRVARVAELIRRTDPEVAAEVLDDDYRSRYHEFAIDRYWQNITASPHFPSVAEQIERLYPASGGRELDGVIAIDPSAVAGLLSLTGPISVPQWPLPITAENAERVLLHDQYAVFEAEERGKAERLDFLGAVTAALARELTSGALPGPQRLGEVLGPLARGRHLQVHAVRPAEQRALERLGVAGALPDPVADTVTVATQNGSASKIDWFLERAWRYDLHWDPATGEVRGEVALRLANRAPTTGLPDYVLGSSDLIDRPGQMRVHVSVLTPLGFTGGAVAGDPAGFASYREAGRWRYSRWVRIDPGEEAEVLLELSGRIDPGNSYRLDLGLQPAVQPDRVAVRLRLADGWQLGTVAGGFEAEAAPVGAVREATATLVLDEPKTLEATAEPTG